jgi:tRNA dimethylallyltransferase
VSETTTPSNQRLIPLVAIVGPTAIGKTALGVYLAQRFNGEIVSADSRQFYRLMDIGTAKPTPEELAAAPHHLINIADPDETVGLSQFLKLAREAVTDIDRRGKLPLLVGGTGQYIRALLQGWQVPNIPPDKELRAELEARAAADPDGLWLQLMALDPATEAFIDRRNLRRVVRALEVTIKSGQPFSALRRRTPPPFRVLSLGLTMDRAALYERADTRVDKMIEAGLPSEVKDLVDRGYGWRLPAMSGLGYIQFRPYVEGEADLGEVVERIKIETHDFIRRQYTWFRPKASDIHWLDAPSPQCHETAGQRVTNFLAPSKPTS